MKPIKTWKDLQHGDVITDDYDYKYMIIERLPYSVLVSCADDFNSAYEWLSIEELGLDKDENGWQIVQPEEEERNDDECNHLFHLERVMYSAGEHSDVAHFICEKCGFRDRRDLTN